MRVLQIINSFGHGSGGAERLAQDLHVDLLAAGIDAHILALMACETAGLRNATSLGFSSPYKPGALLALRKYLSLLTPRPDVIHAHLFPTSAFMAGLKKMGAIPCPVVFTEHSTSNNRRGSLIGNIVDPLIYAQFAKIYCISNGTRDSLLRADPSLEDKSEVILNGATLRFDRFTERAIEGPVRIISVGRLREAKNYQAALEAIDFLPEGSCTYQIIGGGDLLDDLKAKAETIGTPVHFTGHVSDVGPFLQEADIFLMPSLWEGFGLAAVEGMNAGLPVVASDIAGLREVVGTDEAAALLVPPSDPQTIAAVLEALISDPQKRQNLGKAAFERAKLFDRRQMTQAYISAYRSIVPEVARA